MAKTKIAALTLCLCFLHAGSAAAQTRTFKLGAGSQIQFVSDAPLERITGLTSKVSGDISLDPAAPKAAQARIAVPVASIKTNNDLRDEHLRSDNWLDAARYPNIELVVTGVSGIDRLAADTAQEATVAAKLTVHGVSQDLTTQARVRFSPANAASGSEGDSLRVQASFVVKLGNHKVSIPSIVGLKVSPNIQVNVDLKARAAPVAVVAAPLEASAPVVAPSPALPEAKLESTPKPAAIAPKKERSAAVVPKPPAAPDAPRQSASGSTRSPAANAASNAAKPARSSAVQPASVTSSPQGPAGDVQRLRMLMRQTRTALAANDVEQAIKLVRRAQSILAHVDGELAAPP